MRRYLIVSNQTLCGDDLVEAVRERSGEDEAEFFLVVPATPVQELAPSFMPITGGTALTLPSQAKTAAQAQARLDDALKRLRETGATVDGAVADPDPVRAVGSVLQDQDYDEIIVSTLPVRLSRWLRQDIPRRLKATYKLPVELIGGATGRVR